MDCRCVSQKIRRLMVKGDALLIVKQILGIWACKNERLREKVQAIRRLFNQFEEVQLYHIPRKQNEVADLLAQKAVACDESEVQVILAATAIKQPRYQGMESLAPIVSYILEGEFPQSFTKAQKQRLMEKASSYLFLEGALYQRGKDQVCRRIPTVEEIPSILEGLHEEACGGHFAQELTAKKILLSGYVWPSLHIDVQHWCKSCHNCQVNGNKHLLHGPRQLVLANGPFEKWGIDAMGPLPRTKNGKLYILVAIDYMTRWVEAQSVTRVNEKRVSRFVYTHICCRFGTPLEIVSNNGPGFRKGLLTEVYEELHILHRHSTPYYPQSNGLVEKENGIIAGIIRKMVKNKTKLWDDFLDGALWAYRTTYKEATEFTPFHLVYGQEALQPIELNIPTMRLHGKAAQRKEEECTDRLLTLAELEWKREVAYECYKRKATQVKDKLDKEVKDKGIIEGDLVLRKATGKAKGGLVLHDSNGEVVMKKHVQLPDSTSNNEAEYDILLHGLQVCVSQKIRRLMVKGDALLIVKQILDGEKDEASISSDFEDSKELRMQDLDSTEVEKEANIGEEEETRLHEQQERIRGDLVVARYTPNEALKALNNRAKVQEHEVTATSIEPTTKTTVQELTFVELGTSNTTIWEATFVKPTTKTTVQELTSVELGTNNTIIWEATFVEHTTKTTVQELTSVELGTSNTTFLEATSIKPTTKITVQELTFVELGTNNTTIWEATSIEPTTKTTVQEHEVTAAATSAKVTTELEHKATTVNEHKATSSSNIAEEHNVAIVEAANVDKLEEATPDIDGDNLKLSSFIPAGFKMRGLR
ncbi:hypothetical protein L7F22_061327 [Adiantum nelumboides]|nr:hypothetical protein [Adiantum nelumboides]